MRKKLVRLGNSYALIIDKSILELFEIRPDTILQITTDGFGIRIETTYNRHRRIMQEASLKFVYDNRDMLKLLLKMKKIVKM